METADVEVLLAPEGAALLARLAGWDGRDALALGERLRRDHPPALVAAAMTQARLRARARERLGPDADRLLLTPDGLEQATRAVVARRHAARLAGAGATHVLDLCCGLGSDLLAMAAAGLRVTGLDLDPVACALARANAAALGLDDRVRVLAGDATGPLDGLLGPGAADAVFVDPARRRGGRRLLDPADWSPPWPVVERLLAAAPAAGAKVAPGLPHALVPAGAEAEWVSVGGDVVEAAVWSGAAAGPAPRRATLLAADGTVRAGLSGTGAEPPPPAGPVLAHLHEPDGAVVRSGLVAAAAERLGARLLDPTIAYLTSDGPAPAAAAGLVTSYAVLEALPFQLKRLRARVRAHDARDVVVKKRGSALDVDDVRRRLRPEGVGPPLTVVLTRVGGEPWAVLARPARPVRAAADG